MSLQGHVDELTRRHRSLEKQIETEKSHAAHDPLKLREMKRRKLQLKDEMERLSH
ncbi:DUF465 domain-containing protein [Lichenihabitans sp. Uapishka_5]|uniref:YdcH family protein n=1 Tax=Lichenihabitans sp. Uapishka_5 TaxID=3037302 RepID=UPI0029E7EF4E|nr:DUF465 domain-containing protein [Lichenihabitans sp. Uapishka_5]MDX7952696.1 DUF465 domain-containing protein [Lichenihabitans sp. Uapishka_5]